jgi:pimeloyl-ACP methyl ester carboxylesterase
VLTYAALYPDDVSGLVLIDSTAPATGIPAEAISGVQSGSYDLPGRITALLSASSRLGLSRLIAQADYGSLPPQARDEIRASAATPNYAKSTLDEYIQAGESGRQAAALTDFDDKPLAVVTAGVGSNATWMTAQDRLATLSTNSSHRVIDGAIHAGLVHDEQYAAATTQAILDVLFSIRNDERLPG